VGGRGSVVLLDAPLGPRRACLRQVVDDPSVWLVRCDIKPRARCRSRIRPASGPGASDCARSASWPWLGSSSSRSSAFSRPIP
jgi:hypothetical protein